jgi:hypothetical protein
MAISHKYFQTDLHRETAYRKMKDEMILEKNYIPRKISAIKKERLR